MIFKQQQQLKTKEKNKFCLGHLCLATQRAGNTEIARRLLLSKLTLSRPSSRASITAQRLQAGKPSLGASQLRRALQKPGFLFYFHKALPLLWLSHISASSNQSQPAAPDLPTSPFRDLRTARNRCSQRMALYPSPRKTSGGGREGGKERNLI